MNTPKQYTMAEATWVADQASAAVEHFLAQFSETVLVKNVELEEEYQKRDIDLIWFRSKNQKKWCTTIEVKGDRYAHTGNFFFETISNHTKNTPGCFLYTEANYIFYYFVETHELYVLPMPQTRDWFLKNSDRFRQSATSTPVENGFYLTIGKLVPREVVQHEVNGIRYIKIKNI